MLLPTMQVCVSMPNIYSSNEPKMIDMDIIINYTLYYYTINFIIIIKYAGT